MRGWGAIAIAAGVVISAAAPAAAQTPAQFVERFLGENLERLTGTGPSTSRPAAKPKTVQPADTPLLAVPLPHLRPEGEAPEAALGFLPDAATETVVVPTEDLAVPMPRLRTRSAAEAAAAELAAIPPDPKAPPLLPLSELTEPPPAAQSTCGISLAMLGVIATPLQEVDGSGACGMTAPVEVASLDGGAIDISGEAVVNCHLAETFARWMDDTVDPLARKILKGQVTGVRVAAGYACRGRNNIAGARLSEHGKGNAIDIAAFEIDGETWVAVGKADGAGREFLQAVRKSACGPFKTVLGPGSDAYHSDHLHLDLAQRRNGSTYCR